MLTVSQTPDKPVDELASIFNRICPVLSSVLYTLSTYPVTLKLTGISQLLVENVTPHSCVLNTRSFSCMLFTQLSDGLPWYTGWAIFIVWVHVCLITSIDPTHSTGTDVVIDMTISSPSNTSYTVLSGFTKHYVHIMAKQICIYDK